jgi:predicted S18 family serine protease
MQPERERQQTTRFVIKGGMQTVLMLVVTFAAQASWRQAESARREQIIPLLAVTTGTSANGTVVHAVVAFEERSDQSGLQVIFHNAPGRFTRLAQTAIQKAIVHTAQAFDLSPQSWTVTLTVPYPDVTIGGGSLSGMVALSIAAFAQGYPMASHIILTVTITPDGSIAPVGAVPLKLVAAQTANSRRVFVSDQQMAREELAVWPSSIQISPVRSVREAFEVIMETSSTP